MPQCRPLKRRDLASFWEAVWQIFVSGQTCIGRKSAVYRESTWSLRTMVFNILVSHRKVWPELGQCAARASTL